MTYLAREPESSARYQTDPDSARPGASRKSFSLQCLPADESGVGRPAGLDDKVGNRHAEALGGLLRGVLLKPPGFVARPGDDDELVRRELAEGILNRLDGVRIADLGLDMTGLGLDSSLGRARDVCGLRAGLVLVGRQPLKRREIGRRG